jgi:hypothetical protein
VGRIQAVVNSLGEVQRSGRVSGEGCRGDIWGGFARRVEGEDQGEVQGRG